MDSKDELLCVLAVAIIQRKKKTKKEKKQGMVSEVLIEFSCLNMAVINTFKALVLFAGDSGKTKAFLKYLASSSFEFHAT